MSKKKFPITLKRFNFWGPGVQASRDLLHFYLPTFSIKDYSNNQSLWLSSISLAFLAHIDKLK